MINKLEKIKSTWLGISLAGICFSLTIVNVIPSAGAFPGQKKQQEQSTVPASPDIEATEQKVEQSKAQVATAIKQIAAAKALLKAAQADLKANQSQLQALILNHQAQGLVSESGMTPAKAVPIATKSVDNTSSQSSSSDSTDTRIKTDDYNSQSTDNSRPIEMR